MRVSDEDFVANPITISQTGKDIQTNAVNLGNDLTKCITDFENDYKTTSVPSCVQNILDPYVTARKAELNTMVSKRNTIGSLLSKASDLVTFNEQMVQNGFASMYQNVNDFYGGSGDNTDPTNFQRVNDFTHH